MSFINHGYLQSINSHPTQRWKPAREGLWPVCQTLSLLPTSRRCYGWLRL